MNIEKEIEDWPDVVDSKPMNTLVDIKPGEWD